MKTFFNQEQFRLLKFWLPGFVSGGGIWLLMIFLASTPLVRASGLALVIVGVTTALRRMGTAIAMIGGTTLALTPVFWGQTGGGQGQPATIVIALAAAAVTVMLIILMSNRYYAGIGMGLAVFATLYISQIGNPRSLRLTGLVTGWLMFLLIDMLFITNPRSDDAPLLLRTPHQTAPDGSQPVQPYHIYGVFLLLSVGILNDPLLILLLPAVFLGFTLARIQLSTGYWVWIGLIIGIGVFGISTTYFEAQSAYLTLGGWRDAHRWIDMVRLVVGQFTPLGVILGVIGLSRLSRWYPPLGTVSLIAYAAYWAFGLMYQGPNRNLLLLPLLVIQIVWMSYAVLAISDWVSKLNATQPRVARYSVILSYSLLPIWMLLQRLQ